MRLREYLEIQSGLKSKLKEPTKLNEAVQPPAVPADDADDDAWEDYWDLFYDWLDNNFDEYVESFTKEDFAYVCKAGKLPVNGAEVELEGDFVWKAGYAWMDLYKNTIDLPNVLDTNFRSALKQLGYDSTSKVAINKFVQLVLDYLVSKIGQNSDSGIKFYDGESTFLLCLIPEIEDSQSTGFKIGVIELALWDDPYLDIIDLPSLSAYLEKGIKDEFEPSFGKWTFDPITDEYTVDELIDAIVAAYGVEAY